MDYHWREKGVHISEKRAIVALTLTLNLTNTSGDGTSFQSLYILPKAALPLLPKRTRVESLPRLANTWKCRGY